MSPPAESAPSAALERLEAPLAPLDRLPRSLWLGTLAHSHGRLVPRLAEVERLREALRQGRGPDPRAGWPAPPLAAAVAAAFEALGLPRYCAESEALADQVLRSLLWHLDRIPDLVDHGATPAAASARAVEAFTEDWRERCGEVDELVHALGPVGDVLKSTRWDLLRGLLRSAGWQEVVRVRAALASLPELAALIRRLGRARETEEPDRAREVAVPLALETTTLREERREIRVPDLPGETRGVHRSSRVARMLPQEAMLLAHPRLRLVWHARHVERTLLTYEDDDRLEEVVRREVRILFGGGTDVGAPLERALARLGEEGWELADLLLASDGEFGATPEVALAVARAKESRGLRVQGVLVGDRETIGMVELADDVFWVRDWRRFGGGTGASPVHSKSLTATYFPGALRRPREGGP
jgi:hypothetical protein